MAMELSTLPHEDVLFEITWESGREHVFPHQQRCQGIMWPCTYNIQLKATVILDLHAGDYTGTGCTNAS